MRWSCGAGITTHRSHAGWRDPVADQSSPGADRGQLRLVSRGDPAHTGHGDNTTWELLPRPTGDRDDD